jgi:hypothetical protein
MIPVPSREHQRLMLELGRQFANFLKGQPCDVYIAPFDVRFSENRDAADEEVKTVVQPDLSLICDQQKLNDEAAMALLT